MWPGSSRSEPCVWRSGCCCSCWPLGATGAQCACARTVTILGRALVTMLTPSPPTRSTSSFIRHVTCLFSLFLSTDVSSFKTRSYCYQLSFKNGGIINKFPTSLTEITTKGFKIATIYSRSFSPGVKIVLNSCRDQNHHHWAFFWFLVFQCHWASFLKLAYVQNGPDNGACHFLCKSCDL